MRPPELTVRAALVAATVVVATAVTAAVAPGKSGRVLHGGAFFSNCPFSHGSNDDPIVYPRQPGRSHAHTFFGNVSTDARSTLASLRSARTTCRVPGDRAAYWIPTLFQNGREVRPAKAQFYYVMRGYAEMRPFPAGLRMIAGDAHSVGPQRGGFVYWACGAGGGVRSAASTSIPTCRPARTQFHGEVRWEKTLLELHVDFPDCWDGRRLDSADHRSHMAHSVDYVCPASHPVKLPLIRLNVQYPTTGGSGLALSSGGQFSGHADFINAWDQPVLDRLVRECFADSCNDAIQRLRRK